MRFGGRVEVEVAAEGGGGEDGGGKCVGEWELS